MAAETYTHQRQIYTPLDFIGDVGGFTDALQYIGVFVMWMAQGNSVIAFLTSNIFRKANSQSGEIGPVKAIQMREKLRPRTCSSPLCLRRRRWATFERQAKSKIDRELDILTYLRKLFKLEAAFKVIFTKSERLLLSSQACFTLDGKESENTSSDEQAVLDSTSKTQYFDPLVQGLYKRKKNSRNQSRNTPINRAVISSDDNCNQLMSIQSIDSV